MKEYNAEKVTKILVINWDNSKQHTEAPYRQTYEVRKAFIGFKTYEVRKAFIGFKTYEEAVEFAREKNGATVCMFYKQKDYEYFKNLGTTGRAINTEEFADHGFIPFTKATTLVSDILVAYKNVSRCINLEDNMLMYNKYQNQECYIIKKKVMGFTKYGSIKVIGVSYPE